MLDCIWGHVVDPDNPPDGAVIIKGVIRDFVLNVDKVAEHDQDIVSMLDQLPREFRSKESGGEGGWSFLNACAVRDPDNDTVPFDQLPQWTGLHQKMEELVVLGIAADRAQWQLPRQLWSALPGGMPYFVVKDKAVVA